MFGIPFYPWTLRNVGRLLTSSGWPGEQLSVKGGRGRLTGHHIMLGLESCPIARRVLHHLHLPVIVNVTKPALHVANDVTCLQLKRPIGSVEAVRVGTVLVMFIDVS